MPNTEDRTLACRLASGDPESISGFVASYGPFLSGVAGSVLAGRSPDAAVSAEDVVGEVFLRLFEEGGALLLAYRGESSLKPT